jgi:hypothetical protein
MRCVPVLLAVLLTAAASSRPKTCRHLGRRSRAAQGAARAMRADRQAAGEDACRAAAEAFRRRFFSGQTGPDEYRTLAELPPIPPSFDANRRRAMRRSPLRRTRHERRDHHRPIPRYLLALHRLGFRSAAGEVAFLTATLIVIDMTIAGLYWAMSHATGQGEDVIAKLLRKVLYVGAFAYIIGNFNWLASIVFRSFAGLGITATGSAITMENFCSRAGWPRPASTPLRRSSSRSATWPASPRCS